MTLTGSNRRDDALSNASDDGGFSSATNKLRKIRSHSDPDPNPELNAVFGNTAQCIAAPCGRVGAVDDLWIYTDLHGLKNITASKVNCCSRAPVKIDASSMSRDQSKRHSVNVSTSQILCFYRLR